MTSDHSATISMLESEAADAYRGGQYINSEKLYAEAARLADMSGQLVSSIRLRFWTASAQRMQNKNEAALATYTWLLSLRNDPDAVAEIAGGREAIYIYNAYLDLVDVGRTMDDVPSAGLHKVLDEAEQFLEELARPDWSHGLHYQRGQLYKREKLYSEAQQELELALHLRRRYPESLAYTLGAHLLVLGDMLRDQKDYPASQAYYNEIWEGQFNLYERCRAATGLGVIARYQQEWGDAERWGEQGVLLANQLQNLRQHFYSHESYMDILLACNNIEAAEAEAIVLWRSMRSYNMPGSQYLTGCHLSRLRIAHIRRCLKEAESKQQIDSPQQPAQIIANFFQAVEGWAGWALQFLGLQPEQPPPPAPPPSPEQLQARRYLRCTERWMRYAWRSATQLDEQQGTTFRIEYMQSLERILDELRPKIQ